MAPSETSGLYLSNNCSPVIETKGLHDPDTAVNAKQDGKGGHDTESPCHTGHLRTSILGVIHNADDEQLIVHRERESMCVLVFKQVRSQAKRTEGMSIYINVGVDMM